jgi:hypothetical protein
VDVSDWIGIAAAVIALASGGVALRANHHAAKANQKADESNRIAEDALEDARDARESALWDSVLESLHSLVNFNYVMPTEDVGPYLSTVRFRLMLLADKLNRPAVSEWLGQAWKTASLLMREAGEKKISRDAPDLAGEIVKANVPVMSWVTRALIGNLRLLRAQGISDEIVRTLELDANAVGREVRERNGWEDEGASDES